MDNRSASSPSSVRRVHSIGNTQAGLICSPCGAVDRGGGSHCVGTISHEGAGDIVSVVWNVWSTGRELNPRILVLQTSALATSPPVPLSRLMVPKTGRSRSGPHCAVFLRIRISILSITAWGG
jgi:hypothetical protein